MESFSCNFFKKETPAQVFSVNFAKFLRTFLLHKPLDDCLRTFNVWHDKETSADLIKGAVNIFNWEKAFSNTKKVSLFNKTIFNPLLCSVVKWSHTLKILQHLLQDFLVCLTILRYSEVKSSLTENKNKLHRN